MSAVPVCPETFRPTRPIWNCSARPHRRSPFMLMTTTITMPDFVLYALVAGIGVAIVMGATGVFVVWRRMAYFGDTLAHSALLGVAIGFLLGINVNIGIVGV